MIQNYFKVAVRSIFRNKLTAFINICGLALSMTSAIMIYLFVTDELSYDKYHQNADRTYRVTRIFFDQDGKQSLHLSSVAPPIGPLLKNDFGEIELMARTLQYNAVVGLEKDGEMISNTESNVFLAEPNLFKIFDIPVQSGNPEVDFQKPFVVMLSDKTAMRYFNTTDVIGKRLRFNNSLDLEISGVFKSFPLQTHYHPDFLISFVTLEDNNIYGRTGLETNWGNNSFSTYLLLAPGTDPIKLQGRLPEFIDKHFGAYVRTNFNPPATFVASKTTELTLQKVTDVHLHSNLDDEIEVNGNINNVYMMAVIGLFIVLIACFNFVNLSTARATKRAKEVGLRKVVGAFKNQLIGQYLSESVLISIFALVLGFLISLVALPWLNQFTGKELSLNIITNWMLFVGVIAFAVFVGLLAGIYPAFVISGFKPVTVLKGQQGSAKGKAGIRKVLVVTQFGISIVLLIATAITFEQLTYLNNRDLGYDRNQVITLTYYDLLGQNYDAFYNEMLKSSAIKNVGRSSRIPTGRLLDSMGGLRVMAGDSLVQSQVGLKYVGVDDHFFDTYGVDVVAGRSFSKSIPADDTTSFIINEAAAREIGWKTNEEGIDTDFQYGGRRGKLVGIVKDFHFESLHQRVVPMVFIPAAWSGLNNIAVKISGEDMQAGIAHLEKIWREMLPGRPFEYTFLDDRYQKLYDAEQKEGILFTVFSGMAIFIACLGLFGLATFNTMQRVKEIGIRKVLGASVPSILSLLSKEIVILILVANALAWPVAWFLMNKWLDTFAYHINMNILVYFLSAFAAIVLALATVSAQTIKAAMTNPANTLRYE
ncbi:MAG TPA: FtsX-like permease family protein [Cyclobacteriaceae bacterium]|nr:FtsX-like permease family protein [Cyclobacteriaceae bacterium]